MSQSRISAILYLILLTPYGMGVQGIGLFKSLDIPKIGMLLALVAVIRFNAIKVNSWYKFGFNLLVVYHLVSAIFFMNTISLRDFIFVMMFGYVGGYLGTLSIKTVVLANAFYRILQISVALAILEFLFQYNFLDDLRNLYKMSDEARFNADLGRIRLGMKASMGQYASTLPFAYNTFLLYVFLRLEKTIDLPILWRLLTFIAIAFTLSRAVIILFVFFEVIIAVRSIKRMLVIFIISFGISGVIDKTNVVSNYVTSYILNIAEDNGDDGLAARLDNNTGDLAVLDGVSILSGLGPGYLESIKSGSNVKMDTSDSGILVYTLIDRGLLSVCLLLLLYSRLVTHLVKSGFRDYVLLIPLISLALLSISYRYEVLFINYFFLMYYNERITVSICNNTDL